MIMIIGGAKEILMILNGFNKFKFYSHGLPRLDSLKLFFDNWRGRQPMLLQIISDKFIDLKIIERYKEEGIVEKYEAGRKYITTMLLNRKHT